MPAKSTPEDLVSADPEGGSAPTGGPGKSGKPEPSQPEQLTLHNPHTNVTVSVDAVEYAERKAHFDSAGYLVVPGD